jgi:molybdopterin-guanine dinucleotide biosynthesis protein A
MTTSPPHPVDAALLAGGAGRRIGGGKPFLPLGGRPLAAWAAAAIVRDAHRLIVVARTLADAAAVAEAVRPHVAVPVVTAADRPGIDGPVAGLLGAADAASGWLLTAPVDTPFLPPDLLARLAATGGPAIAAGDRPHPTLLLAPAAAVAALAPAGSLARTLAPLAPQEVLLSEDALFNVNTVADLAKAEARFRR